MDEKPFFEFNTLAFEEADIEELRRFTKEAFEVNETIEVARELKYTREMKRVLTSELRRPSEDLVKLFASRVYQGRMTQTVREQFTELTRRALREFVNDRINERLTSALVKDERGATQGPRDQSPDTGEEEVGGQETEHRPTQDELQGFYVVKAILVDSVDVRRVFLREAKTYASVILDDNSRKKVCRLGLLTRRKHLVLFDEKGEEERLEIEDIDDIYRHAARLRETASLYPPQGRTSASV